MSNCDYNDDATFLLVMNIMLAVTIYSCCSMYTCLFIAREEYDVEVWKIM